MPAGGRPEEPLRVPWRSRFPTWLTRDQLHTYFVDSHFDTKVDSIDELVTRLNWMENYRAVRNEKRRSVIHLIAKELPTEGTPLDQKIEAVRYSGSLQLFVDKLQPMLNGKLGTRTDYRVFGDVQTQVDVQLEPMTVRDALTLAAPEKDYGPMLWQMLWNQTKPGPGFPEFTVIYAGLTGAATRAREE